MKSIIPSQESGESSPVAYKSLALKAMFESSGNRKDCNFFVDLDQEASIAFRESLGESRYPDPMLKENLIALSLTPRETLVEVGENLIRWLDNDELHYFSEDQFLEDLLNLLILKFKRLKTTIRIPQIDDFTFTPWSIELLMENYRNEVQPSIAFHVGKGSPEEPTVITIFHSPEQSEESAAQQ